MCAVLADRILFNFSIIKLNKKMQTVRLWKEIPFEP